MCIYILSNFSILSSLCFFQDTFFGLYFYIRADPWVPANPSLWGAEILRNVSMHRWGNGLEMMRLWNLLGAPPPPDISIFLLLCLPGPVRFPWEESPNLPPVWRARLISLVEVGKARIIALSLNPPCFWLVHPHSLSSPFSREQSLALPLGEGTSAEWKRDLKTCLCLKQISTGFPGGSVVKNLPAKARDADSILPWVG